MASLNYNTSLYKMAKGGLDFSTLTFYAMLVTSSYSPNKDTDDFRNDVTNEVTGTGYSSGGAASAVTVTQDNANDRIDIDFADVSWAGSTLTAAAAVLYVYRGGASSADEVISYIDFGGNVTTSGGTFTLDMTGPLRLQN